MSPRLRGPAVPEAGPCPSWLLDGGFCFHFVFSDLFKFRCSRPEVPGFSRAKSMSCHGAGICVLSTRPKGHKKVHVLSRCRALSVLGRRHKGARGDSRRQYVYISMAAMVSWERVYVRAYRSVYFCTLTCRLCLNKGVCLKKQHRQHRFSSRFSHT